jgi:integrase
MRAEITDSLLERRPFKRGGRIHISDSRLTGLAVIIGGRKKVILLRKDGRELARWVWPVVPVATARAEALEVLRRLHAGEDVAQVRAQSRRAGCPTLREALAMYVKAKGTKLRASTAGDYADLLDQQAKDWLDKPLSEITPDAFLARYQAISSPARAAYLLRVVRAVARLVVALREDLRLTDPTTKAVAVVGSRAPSPRTRSLSAKDLPAFHRAVAALPDDRARDLLVTLLLTGMRLDEARLLDWSELDVDNGTIRLPGTRTKNHREHVLPLGPALTAQLKARRDAAGVGAVGPVFGIGMPAYRVQLESVRKVGLRFSAQDLRRTFANAAQTLFGDEVLTKALLNHAPVGVTQRHYLSVSAERLRSAMIQIEEALHS